MSFFLHLPRKEVMYVNDRMSPPPTIDSNPVKVGMHFPEAIEKLTKGAKIRRESWPVADYGLLKDGWLSIYRNGEFFTWKVNDGDLLGEDWVTI